MFRRTATLACLLFVSLPAWGRDPDPKDFPLVAKVVELSSRQETSQITSTPTVIPSPCSALGRESHPSQCQDSTVTTHRIQNVTEYIVTVEIGDTIYDLAGPPAQLGEYRARLRNGIELLAKDQKGRWKIFRWTIIGERSKTAAHPPT